MAQQSEKTRNIPRQQRSRETLALLLEAAAQVLERGGADAFNTNAVAARAGVSIGTLYRYFPDKQALLAVLVQQEIDAQSARNAAILGGETSGLAPDRAMIRSFLHAFADRTQARRVAMTHWLGQADHVAAARGHGEVTAGLTDAAERPLSPVAAFVLSRAVHGAMRAAVLEGADFLCSPAFEDELVRLGRAYVRALAEASAMANSE